MRHTQYSVITVVDISGHRYLLTRKELRELAFENELGNGNYRSVTKQSLKILFKRKRKPGTVQARSVTKGFSYDALTDQKTTRRALRFQLLIYPALSGDRLSIGCKSFPADETIKIKRWAIGEPQA